VKPLSGAPLLDRLLTLPTNIRQGWKGLQWTNTQCNKKFRKKCDNIGPWTQNLLKSATIKE